MQTIFLINNLKVESVAKGPKCPGLAQIGADWPEGIVKPHQI
jgi:hypothetical protein